MLAIRFGGGGGGGGGESHAHKSCRTLIGATKYYWRHASILQLT